MLGSCLFRNSYRKLWTQPDRMLNLRPRSHLLDDGIVFITTGPCHVQSHALGGDGRLRLRVEMVEARLRLVSTFSNSYQGYILLPEVPRRTETAVHVPREIRCCSDIVISQSTWLESQSLEECCKKTQIEISSSKW